MENRTIVGDGFACYTLEESFNNITLFEENLPIENEIGCLADWTMSEKSRLSSTLELISDHGFIDSLTSGKYKRRPVKEVSRIPRPVKSLKKPKASRIPRYVGQKKTELQSPAIESFLHLLQKHARVEGRRQIDARVGEVLASLTTEPVEELTVTIDKRIRKRTMMVIIKPDKKLFTAF